MATIRHNVVDSAKTDTMQQKQATLNPNRPRHQNPNVTLAEKCIEQKIVGTEPMRQLTPAKRNATSPSQPTRSTNNPYPLRPLSQNTKVAAPTVWGKCRREGVHNRGPPKHVRRRIFN